MAELSGAEEVDPRAFRADAYRTARLAQTVLERLPAFSSVFLGRPGAWAYALGFGTSPEFAALVRLGRDLGQTAVEYLARCAMVDEALASVLRLEAALCAPLRSSLADEPGEGGRYRLGRRAQIVSGVPSLGAWYAERMALLVAGNATSSWEQVLDIAKTGAGRGPAASSDTRPYLVVRAPGPSGGTVEDLEGPMAALLELLRAPRSLAEICAAFPEDLSTEDAAELLEALVADGVVDCVAGEAC